jgi:recombination protein RecT
VSQVAVIQQFQQEMQNQSAELAVILPDHLSVERFMKTTTMAVQNNPELLNADRQSLFNSLLRCAGDGLVPDNREAALVEFKANLGTKEAPNWGKKIQYMPMVDGVLKRARQSGEVSLITARAVYQNDQFDYWVDEHGEHINHRPLFTGDRGPMILVYAMAKMKTGDVVIEPMTMADIERVKASSKTSGFGPWKDWFDRMALKSALHRLARRLPNSSEIMEMLGNDNWMYEMNSKKERDVSSEKQVIEHYPNADFERNFPKWKTAIEAGKLDAKTVIGNTKTKGGLTDAQREQVTEIQQGEVA